MEFYPLNELVEEMIQNAFPLAGEGGFVFINMIDPVTGQLTPDWAMLVEGSADISSVSEEEGCFVLKRTLAQEQSDIDTVTFEHVAETPSQAGEYILTVDSNGVPTYEEHQQLPSQAGNYIITVDSNGDATYTALPSQAGKYVVTVGANGAVTFSQYRLPDDIPNYPGSYTLHVLQDGTLSWQDPE